MNVQFNAQSGESLESVIQIKVIGVGGGGRLAIESMMGRYTTDGSWLGVELIYMDTDAGALDIRATIDGAHMLFILVALGGNTGTGAASVIARLAKEMGILTVVGVVTEPFDWEDRRGMTGADDSLAELGASADAAVVMRYSRLLEVLREKSTPDAALVHASGILANFVRDTALAVNVPCHVGVDFEDVRTVLGQPGKAAIGTALARGPDRARIAVEQAMVSPLLDGFNLVKTQSLLVLVSAAQGSFRLSDSKSAMNTIRAILSSEAHIIYGTTYDDELGDAIRVTVVATGPSNPQA